MRKNERRFSMGSKTWGLRWLLCLALTLTTFAGPLRAGQIHTAIELRNADFSPPPSGSLASAGSGLKSALPVRHNSLNSTAFRGIRHAHQLAAATQLAAAAPTATHAETGAEAKPVTLRQQFGYSYLLAYMFFLSLCLGALFLVLAHHLFDASWSVPIRRICEHLACLLFPVMAILWIPIGVLAPKIYPWMSMARPDHALHSKEALLNKPVWYGISIALFLIWGVLTRGL